MSSALADAADAPSFPERRTCPYHPPESYKQIGARGPLNKVTLWNGRRVWLITGYELARTLLTDTRLSADRTRQEYPTMAPHLEAQAARKLVLVGEDPPLHDKHRRLLNPEFSLKRARVLQPDIQRIIDELVDNILAIGPGADLVPEYAMPIPSRVMSALLGVPYEDHDFFQAATAGVMQARDQAQSQAAGTELAQYLGKLVDAEVRRPSDGIVGRLTEHVRSGELTQDELAQLTMVLMIAGLETTSSMIPLGVITLLEHPEQLAEFTSGEVPVPTAVEELLRFLAVTDFGAVRWITGDIELGPEYGDEVIRTGDGIVVSSTMANRDPGVHHDPHEFDISRGNRQHLTFGYGIHQCLGQNLARLQLEIAYRTLFARIPTLRLGIASEDIRMRTNGTMQGVERLPVEW
ncbi:MAG TPA: cytochrome P450 [Pseudonocardiaceae bacterium]|nr:cytochrome P450 [Pseudonocardiaceae bacterium]